MDRPALKNSLSLFSLYLTYFSDYFCWGAAIAFTAVYMTDNQSVFIEFFWNRQISLGLALAAFPVGEIIGSAILGDLSDWIGRKKVLMWGLWGSILSVSLSIFSLGAGQLFLFLFSQLAAGFFAGKQAMAQAAIVEVHTGFKGQKLAFLSVIGGIAWILGPFLGGLLMQEPFKSHGGFIWPSILVCFIFVLSLLCTHYFFLDTYKPMSRSLSPLGFLKSILDLFLISWKEKLFFLFLINLLGWYLVITSLSDFLVIQFRLVETQIGFFNSYLSLCFTIGGIIGTMWILRIWRSKNVLLWSLPIGSIALFLLFQAEKTVELWICLAIGALTEAWIYPAYQTILSDQTSEKNQGKLFGLIGASNGVCQFIAAAILALGTSKSSILIAAFLFLFSAALLPLTVVKKA